MKHHRQPFRSKIIDEYEVYVYDYKVSEFDKDQRPKFIMHIWQNGNITTKTYHSEQEVIAKFDNVCAILKGAKELQRIKLPAEIAKLVNAEHLLTKEYLRNYLSN